MRKLRIPASVQLPLAFPEDPAPGDKRWWILPDQTRQVALALLARLIAKGVVDEQEQIR